MLCFYQNLLNWNIKDLFSLIFDLVIDGLNSTCKLRGVSSIFSGGR